MLCKYQTRGGPELQVIERGVFMFCRTDEMHHFIKMSLQKNPKKRPPAEKLLTVRESRYSSEKPL